ncbi:MAG: signal peptidase I [Armatimonadota bacterium]|nr:signal peptidase I [Armatimonadota bacterium]
MACEYKPDVLRSSSYRLAYENNRTGNIRLITVVAMLGLVAIGWRMSPYRFGIVVGDSMTPSLKPNHPFLMEIRSYKHYPPAKGDVVVFEWNGEMCIKRVVGSPGETLWLLEYPKDKSPLHTRYVIPASELYQLQELYGKLPNVAKFKKVRVPQGCVYVVGDAQGLSLDSRYFGPVETEKIIGKVLLPTTRKIPSLIGREQLMAENSRT